MPRKIKRTRQKELGHSEKCYFFLFLREETMVSYSHKQIAFSTFSPL